MIGANKLFPSKNKMTSRRAVAPVIATLLLIAIAVVGGSVMFAIAEESYSRTAISTSPQMDYLVLTGFDARDVSVLTLHDDGKANNSASPGNFDGQTSNGLQRGERVAVYVQNNSISTVYVSEVRFAGTELAFVPGGTLTAYNTAFMNPGEFVIATKGTSGVANLSSTAKLQPGQEATFLIELDHRLTIEHDTSFKIVTGNGAGYVKTINLGNQIHRGF